MKSGERSYLPAELGPILKAVADRMIPKDAWPSAIEGGVWEYLQRRAREDTATWTELIEPGLRTLDAEAIALHHRPFSDISSNEQDRLLQDLELDRVRNWPVSPKLFFTTLLGLIVEGY